MTTLKALAVAALIYCCSGVSAAKPKFRVVAFYTGKEDPAHISFLHEAERWFPAMAAKYHFSYDATSDWHNLNADFLAANTWRPTSAVLRVEDRNHPATRHLPATFRSSPSEWYRWEKDLRQNPDIDILLSIDSTSFPLGTGPKPHEIWHSGYYPVVWTNKNFKMIYLNMGHNDIDYEHKYDTTNRTLSHTLNNPVQDQLIIDGLLWLGGSPAPSATAPR